MLESRFKLLIPVALVAVTLQVFLGLGGGCGSATREMEGSSGDGGASDAGEAPDLEDASVAEDAGDGSCPETDPCWVRIDEGPDYCLFEEARHPEAVLQPRWVPCDGVDGCRELQVDPDVVRGFDDYRFVEGAPFLAVGQLQRDDPTQRHVLVLSSMEKAVAAWRADGSTRTSSGSPAACLLTTASIAHGNRLVGLAAVRDDRPHDSFYRVLMEMEGRGRGSVDFPGLLIQVSMSEDLIVAKADRVWETFAFVDGGFVKMADSEAISKSGAGTHVTGPHVFWLDVTFPDSWSVFHAQVGVQPNRVLPARTDGTRIRDFRTDGRTMAWVVEPMSGRGPREIWTSPFATTEEDVRPRLAATLPDGVWAQVGPDRYTLTGDGVIYVMTMSTGELRTFNFRSPGATLIRTHPIWVTEDELALYYERDEDGEALLRRIDITSLPPFHPPD